MQSIVWEAQPHEGLVWAHDHTLLFFFGKTSFLVCRCSDHEHLLLSSGECTHVTTCRGTCVRRRAGAAVPTSQAPLCPVHVARSVTSLSPPKCTRGPQAFQCPGGNWKEVLHAGQPGLCRGSNASFINSSP